MASLKYLLIAGALCFASVTTAKEPPSQGGDIHTSSQKRLRSRCENASAQVDLQINNVRARIMNGGDMWWDLVGAARYEIPRVQEGSDEPKKHALFAGSIWIGGLENGQVMAAAQTYRQQGNDFWPGPIDTFDRSVTKEDCDYWDQVFQVTKEEIDNFVQDFQESGGKVDIPNNIRQWPGNGRSGFGDDKFMAPYVDVGGGRGYDPEAGDYPDIKGDQAVWYVYNDLGGLKTETGSRGIGLELRTMAFGFASSDEINNMTFYETTIFNRGERHLDKTYVGQWVDADLGYFADDYVGCDTIRGLGICYNADNFDDGISGYGANPPSVGVDFFEGPKADLELRFEGEISDGIDNDGDGEVDETDTTFFKELRALGYKELPSTYEGDGIDNNRNGVVDEPNEDIIMSKFVYYNNTQAANGNVTPGVNTDYYGYLTGNWKNGDCIKYGGNGFSVSSGRCTNFMFPSDPRDPDGWSEVTANNEPGDRRFLQSAGPFTLKPGAVNKVTIGVVWARASSGGNTGSYDLLLLADDKAQKLFNNGFKLLDGPDAPMVAVVELDREALVMMERKQYMDSEAYYEEEIGTQGERIPYKFQGYQLYQLLNSQVTPDQLNDPDFAREVWQVDREDEIKKLVNRAYDSEVDAYIPQVMVDGANEGISHSIQLTTDAFASGSALMINHKTYHYMLLAYASIDADNTSENRQYLSGRKIQRFSVTPGKTEMLFDGMALQARYGEGPELTRLEGLGNGGRLLELSAETVDTILLQGKDLSPTYKKAQGPVEVKVVDPMKVPVADFYLRFIDSSIFDTDREVLFASIDAEKEAIAALELRIEICEANIVLYRDTVQQWANRIGRLREQYRALVRVAKDDTTTSDDSAKYALLSEYKYREVEAAQKDSVSTQDEIALEITRLDRQTANLALEQNKLRNQQSKAEGVVWELTRVNGDGTKQVVRAERGLIDNNEMVIDEWGISITAGPEYGPGVLDNDPVNGFLGTSLSYEDGQTEWLTAMPQVENTNASIPVIFDWIRSGNYFADDATADPAFHDVKYNELRTGHSGVLDKNAAFKETDNLMAPYMLTSRSKEYNGLSTYGLCQSSGYGAECSNIFLLPSVDLVFTSDRSKWSRVLVVEMGEDPNFTEGSAEKFHVREHASLELEPDAKGNPVYSTTSTGFSWFPGYAMNVETGERLNIIVGENSSLKGGNTKDMIWNPNDKLTDPNIPLQVDGGAIIGGMHYVYIMGASSNYNVIQEEHLSTYDGCQSYSEFLRKEGTKYSRLGVADVWSDCMWVMPALVAPGFELNSWKNGLIPTTTKVSARVNKAYQTRLPSDLSRNHHLPMLHFNTANIAPIFSREVASDALSQIRVVPNPYYAQSDFERTQLDNLVKLTNLPRACTIKIYSVNGVLVKTFTKAETNEAHNRDLLWDLKNEAEVPVASGAYIIHVEAPGIGSQIVKLMAIMKPVDLDTF